jgi:hypothetical protein
VLHRSPSAAAERDANTRRGVTLVFLMSNIDRSTTANHIAAFGTKTGKSKILKAENQDQN